MGYRFAFICGDGLFWHQGTTNEDQTTEKKSLIKDVGVGITLAVNTVFFVSWDGEDSGTIYVPHPRDSKVSGGMTRATYFPMQSELTN